MQSLQGLVPSLGPTDPIHHDEICILRDHRRGHLQLPAETEVGIQQGSSNRCRFCWWLPGRYPLCRHFSPSRRDGQQTERKPKAGRGVRRRHGQDLQRHRLQGTLEWAPGENCHGWNSGKWQHRPHAWMSLCWLIIQQTGLQWMMYVLALIIVFHSSLWLMLTTIQLRLFQDLHGPPNYRRRLQWAEEDLKQVDSISLPNDMHCQALRGSMASACTKLASNPLLPIDNTFVYIPRVPDFFVFLFAVGWFYSFESQLINTKPLALEKDPVNIPRIIRTAPLYHSCRAWVRWRAERIIPTSTQPIEMQL